MFCTVAPEMPICKREKQKSTTRNDYLFQLRKDEVIRARDGFDPSLLHGHVEPGFEEVRAEFVRNFLERGELGSSCALYHKGRLVVDLWGGYRDLNSQRPWEADTLVMVYSTTKGIAAMAMAVAHSKGLFELDEPVATYWPEFAAAGKHRITVRQLLAHQAGLSAVDEPLDVEKLADLDLIAAVIAKQAPAWEPGTRHGYHGFTLGLYENELIRRVDPQHRSLGRFFQDEIAKPLGIEFYIGLPAHIRASRVANIEPFDPFGMTFNLKDVSVRLALNLIWPRSLAARSLLNPKLRGPHDLDRPEFRALELPSANGIGHARAIAKGYSLFANGGHELGIQAATMDALTARATVPTLGRRDAIIGKDTSYSFGFWKRCSVFSAGVSEKVFGAMGVGGSIGFADPDAEIGYSYVTNRMSWHLFNDPREKALRDASYRCLEKVGAIEFSRAA